MEQGEKKSLSECPGILTQKDNIGGKKEKIRGVGHLSLFCFLPTFLGPLSICRICLLWSIF